MVGVFPGRCRIDIESLEAFGNFAACSACVSESVYGAFFGILLFFLREYRPRILRSFLVLVFRALRQKHHHC